MTTLEFSAPPPQGRPKAAAESLSRAKYRASEASETLRGTM
jgi:hypothetical protein